MKLTITDRLTLSLILPQEGNFLELKTKETISKKVELTQDEHKEYEVTADGRNIAWNPEKAQEVEFDFEEAEKLLIKKQLKKLDEENKLRSEMLHLFELFV